MVLKVRLVVAFGGLVPRSGHRSLWNSDGVLLLDLDGVGFTHGCVHVKIL